MASNINPDWPKEGDARTGNVRANFQSSKDEIEALQTLSSSNESRIAALEARMTAAEGRLDGHDADIANRYTKAESDDLFITDGAYWEPDTQVTKNAFIRGQTTSAVATVATFDSPDIQPTGDTYWISGLGEAPPYTIQTVVDQNLLTVGQRITATTAGFLNKIRIYAIVDDPQVKYTVYIVRYPGQANESVIVLAELSFNTIGWFTLSLGKILIADGTTFDICANIVNQGAGSTEFTGTWDYITANGDAAAGQIVHQTAGSGNEMRINHAAQVGGNFQTQLESMQPGDEFSGAGMNWVINEVLGHDAAQVRFGVTPAIRSTPGQYSFTGRIYVPATIPYANIANHYAGNGQVVGMLGVNGYPNIVLDEDAYGIDAEVQAAYISPDYNYKSIEA